LIKPVEHLLGVGKQLCIVPDKILSYLPFAALKSQASGKYFIEEHGFVLSPSSSMFIICSDAAREKESSKSERLLSVGNPKFDGSAFSNLANLPEAAREAEMIVGYYDSPGPIIGAAATKKLVESEMEKSDVIHLATHAVVDEWHPMRSKLLLAGGVSKEDSDGVLHAYEIYKLNLSRAKLVVLSACQTGVEKYYGGEGMIGLSRPFTAKRIPLVVASLWPVDSGSTASLMIMFHRYRKSEHIPTAEALRQAQLSMLRDENGSYRLPYHWAPFVAIGGYASY
jgi:CHAT domain-containing protein